MFGGTPGTLNKTGDGVYQGLFKASDGVYGLTAKYTDASLASNRVNIRIDTVPPVFTISVPAPTRIVDGGMLTDRDPMLPEAWRGMRL